MRKENWTYRKVKEVCDKASSNIVLNKIENNVGDYALYGASGFVKGVDFFHREEPYIGIIKDGSGVGRVDVFPAKSSLVGTMQYILPKKDCLLKYLCYALQSLKLADFVTGAAIPHIYFRDYGECVIPIPPLSTQSRIVSELDLFQSIIDKQKAQLKELDNLAQAIFYDMFGDPVENEKGWEVKKFGEVASFKNGLNFSPNENGEMYYFIGVSDFQAKSEINCNENLTIIHLNDAINKEYLLQNDDILFVRSNGNKQLIARNILVKTNNLNVTFSGFCIRARITRNDVSAFFINSLLKLPTSHEALTLKGRGCNISNLNQTTLNDYEIILPPLPLQQSFAQKVESIERQKELINQSIREAQTLFDSRMEYYFGE